MKKIQQICKLITQSRGTGIELGVASGFGSRDILRFSDLATLYSVDMWAGDRGHDTKQCDGAAQRLAPFGIRSRIIRTTFDLALTRFPNEYFDFIYIDGYAHTAQAQGKTLTDWFPKCKKGGIFAGDDYCRKQWRDNVRVINDFVFVNKLKLIVINPDSTDHGTVKYPSWVIRK